MKTLEIMRETLKNPQSLINEWKAEDKKIIGYRCIYVPEEIIYAAGMMPYPLFGTPKAVSLADSYFQAYICEFVRNLFDRALNKEFDFLDGLVLCNTCDATRKLYDHWGTYIKTPLCYIINNPQETGSEAAYKYQLKELKAFKQEIESFSGEKISDRVLSEAISLYNETRRLLKELYSLRKENPPALSGSEALDVVMAAMLMPKKMANELLKELIKEVKAREVPEVRGPRILITGSIIDNPALIKLVEEAEGVVVVEDLCTGTKYFWEEVKGDNPLDALCKYTTERCFCACTQPVEARFDYLQELIKEFSVDGVIYFNLKYCDPFIYEGVLFQEKLQKIGIPAILLETGHDLSGLGQLRTRIQAFIEMVG